MLHPVAYYSCKFTTPEINYPIYDKEILVIIASFEEWRPYLAGVQHCIQVITDHKNLIYFSTTQTLNRRQTQWSTFLADYDFEIIFRPCTQHTTTDVLSCQSEFELTPEDEAYVQQSQNLLKCDQFYNFTTCLLRDDSLLKKIAKATTIDKFATEVKASITNPSHEPKRPDLARFTIQDNLLFRDNL